MKTILSTAAFAALTLLAVPADAETVCNNCEYPHNFRGGYLGAFGSGDRATFGDRNIAANRRDQGCDVAECSFQNLWVFDLLNDAGGVFSLNTKAATALNPHFNVEIYEDGGSICDATRCSEVTFSFDNMKLIMSGFVHSWSTNLYPLPAGRYVIRINGVTRPTGEAAYTGQLSVR
jgi:hypothetical protein